MIEPLISVIIPVYKVEEYLSQCVDSVIHQTYSNLEIILVDDGSPDRCPEICDEYAKKDNRIVVIHQKNTGLSGARNHALDLCTGDYISFVDSDDWIEPEAYDVVMKAMKKYNVDVVAFSANIVKDGKIVETRFGYYPDGTVKTSDEMLYLMLTDTVGGQAWQKIYSRKCWKNVRFPEKRLYEDLAISYLPFLCAEKGTLFLQKCLYNYRLNAEGISLGKNPEKGYHIFLGFKDHLNYAIDHCIDAQSTCLMKTTESAMSYLNAKIRYNSRDDLNHIEEVVQWVESNRRAILKNQFVPLKSKAKVLLYSLMPNLYHTAFRLHLSLSGKKENGK